MPVKRRVAKARALKIGPEAGEQFRKLIALEVAAEEAHRAARDAEAQLERMVGFDRKPWITDPLWQEQYPCAVTAGAEEKHAIEVEAHETFLELLKAAGMNQNKYFAVRYQGKENQ